MTLSVLYRGLLSSCNYGCTYCPFAKRSESRRRLAEDRAGLARFEDWLTGERRHRWRVLFTPWGEALVRRWYREALLRLSQAGHIELVAAQTNLSCGLEWLKRANPRSLALWATYHPGETSLARFVRKVQQVRELGIRISVGMVAAFEHFEEIAGMRRALPRDQYLWLNAQQPRPRQYTDDDVAFLTSIDPHFRLTLEPQRTRAQACSAGETMFTVDAVGDMRRCHFVSPVIGNVHRPDWEAGLVPRTCPNAACHCYLGLAAYLPAPLAQVFGERVLARSPVEFESAFCAEVQRDAVVTADSAASAVPLTPT